MFTLQLPGMKAGLIAALIGVTALSACKEEETAAAPAACTEEQAQEKVTQLMTRMQEVAQSNPERLAEIGTRAQELQAGLVGAEGDIAAACAAIDELLADLG